MRPIKLTLALLLIMASTADAQRFRWNRRQNNPATPATKKIQTAKAEKRPMMEVDENEIRRRGNIVQRVGPGIWSDPGINAFGDAMATPPSQRHKWFISVVTDNSELCKKLQKDFATNADLRVWANPGDHNQSWSHYSVYNINDKSQAFRFKDIKLQGFPTVIIQPPLNQQYGDPKSVVAQILCHDGDCKKLSDNLRSSIGRYIKTVQNKQQGKRQHQHQTKRPAQSAPKWSAKRTSIEIGGPEKKVDGPTSNSCPTCRPRVRRGGWGQLEPPAPSGSFEQEPESRRRPRRDPPFDPAPAGPLRPNIAPNLPNVLPPQVLPPSDQPIDDEPVDDDSDSSYAEAPEALIISDAAIGISETNNKRIRSIVRGLRRQGRFKNLRTRYLDLTDAKRKGIPVAKEDLPAIILTNRNRILDKITGQLLPNVETEPRPMPGLSDVPWQAILSVFMGGGGFLQLALWGLRFWRRRRKRQGKTPLINDELFELIVENVPGLIEKYGPAVKDLLAKSKEAKTNGEPNPK